VGNRRTLIAAAAIVLAIAAGAGVYMYTANADKRAEDKVRVVDAYVASVDIPKGTSGDAALTEGMIHPQKVLAGSVPAAAVRDSSTLQGKIAASAISAQQFITDTSFVAPAEGGGGTLAAAIAGSNRVAVSVSVDLPRGVAGQIAPGDRVDLATANNGPSAYILQNVKVLAVGQQTAATSSTPEGQAPQVSGLLTFEVTPEDALKIEDAVKANSLYLSLRPLAASGTANGGNSSVSASGG